MVASASTGSCSPAAASDCDLRGVTYGPFAPDREGQPFPTRKRVCDDLASLQALGANSIRTLSCPAGVVTRSGR